MRVLEVGFKDGPTLRQPLSGGLFVRMEFATVEAFNQAPLSDFEATHFDLLVLFPACSTFSMMAIRHHWAKVDEKLLPKSEAARQALLMLEKMAALAKTVPFWILENLKATIHKHWTLGTPHQITHCQYGSNRMKPTTFWNNFPWPSKAPCHYGASCHEATPRGSRRGTQSMKTKKERALLPQELSAEILHWARVAISGKGFPQ